MTAACAHQSIFTQTKSSHKQIIAVQRSIAHWPCEPPNKYLIIFEHSVFKSDDFTVFF